MKKEHKKPLAPYDMKAHLSARRAIKEGKAPSPSAKVSFQILYALHKVRQQRGR